MAEPVRVVVDGSNLATEGRKEPSLEQLEAAVRAFADEHPDTEVTVVVDATFAHRIPPSQRAELERAELAGELVTPPAGTVGRGDAFVLRIADRSGAAVLSNDSFQEFHEEHPWLFEDARLIGGKPVPGVGWIFAPRLPVRGARSRRAKEPSAKRATEKAPAKATAKAAATEAAPKKTASKRAKKAATRATPKQATEKATEKVPAKATAKAAATEAAPKKTASKRAKKVATRATPKQATEKAPARATAKAAATEAAPKKTASKRAKKAATRATPKKATEKAPAKVPEKVPAKATAKAAKANPRASLRASTAAPTRSASLEEASTDSKGMANDPLPFISLLAEHPLGSELEAEVVSFTSHGAMVDVDLPDGLRVHCYLPLTNMADPPPRRAREILTRGERHRVVLQGLDPSRRAVEVALPRRTPRGGSRRSRAKEAS